MKQINSLIIILFLVTSCNVQDKGKISDKELQKLFEREKKNQERSKYGGNNSEIQIISNPKDVENLKNYIVEKKSEKLKRELPESKTLPEQCKAGDKTTVPLMIDVLNGNDLKARKEIYHKLERNYDESDDYKIVEPKLTKAILNNITIPEDEKSVIQLAGLMDIKGYPEVFEKQLLSGKPQDKNRLIYWLGQDGKSQKTLEYIEKLVFADNFDFENNDYIMSGLEGFAENGNVTTKRKAFEICLNIYNKKLIAKEKFEEMKTSWSSANPAIGFTEILFKSGDKRVIPIAKEFIKNGVCEEKALSLLTKLEGDKHKELVFQFLKNEDKFFDGLNPATEIYKISKDQNLVETILTQFEKRNDHTDYSIKRVVSAIISMEASEYFSKLDDILKNKDLINSLSKQYDLTKGSIETIAKEIYELGVISKPVSQEVLNKAKKLSKTEETGGYVYDFLTVSGLYQWFDAETGTVPVDYDNLILEFSKNSNGKLNEIEVLMDADIDEDYNVKYKIYVSANDKVYTMSPDDIGDWYDVQMTLNLMNTIAKDANLTERFVFIDTGDQTVQTIFGPIKNVNQFIKKYTL